MPLSEIRAVVFDVFGTVVDWRGGVARESEPFLARHGRGDTDGFALAQAWRRQYLAVMPDVRSGNRPFTRLDVLHREALERALPECGIDPARIDPAELTELNLVWHRLPPWPDVVPGLSRLKQAYLIAPHSNGNIILLADMAKRAGLPWDVILGAEVVRAYKQSPESYLRTAEVLDMRPEEICLVSAHNSDLGNARRHGMCTGFVPRPTEHGPGQTSDLAPEHPWDVVASGFDELADRLQVRLRA